MDETELVAPGQYRSSCHCGWSATEAYMTLAILRHIEHGGDCPTHNEELAQAAA